MPGGLKGSEGMEKVLFELLRIAACGAPADNEIKTACTPEMLDAVYTLANKHDLAHLVGQAVSKLGLPDGPALQKCKEKTLQAFYRYAQFNYEYECICKTLEGGEIPFIPLKGSVLRGYYPEGWFRTSCDIDVLVKEADLDAAVQLLQEVLSYKLQEKSGHDVSMFSPSGVHLELHFTVIEDERLPATQRVLNRYWEDSAPVEGMEYQRAVSDEMFYFYHMAHMAKHMENGGCGIRPFLDIWVLNNRVSHDVAARNRLLEEGGMLTFARAAENLTGVWFSGDEQTPQSLCFGRFILDGGVYGNMENMVTLRQTKKGSKVKYLLSRIFVSHSVLKQYFPVLEKHKWLTPIYQVARWVKLLFGGKLGSSVREAKVNASLSPEKIKTTRDMLDYLGL